MRGSLRLKPFLAPVAPLSGTGSGQDEIKALHEAVLSSTIIAYAQGLSLISAAAREQSWHIHMPTVAKIWRNGCVIRSVLLADIAEAFDADPDLANLMCAPRIAPLLAEQQTGLRQTIKDAVYRRNARTGTGVRPRLLRTNTEPNACQPT